MRTTVSPCSGLIQAEDTTEFLIQTTANLERVQELLAPDCVQLVNYQYAVAYYAGQPLEALQRANLVYNNVPKLYGLMDSSNLEDIGINRVRRISDESLLGRGVLIGFVDTGIDYTHPAFVNRDNTSRILAIWDQTGTQAAPPEGYLYGSLYTRAQLNEALASPDPLAVVPTQDSLGHGTFLAGVAAGNTDAAADFDGIAPLADIAVVKLRPAKQYLKRYFCNDSDAPCYMESDILVGLSFLQRLANQYNYPIVLCVGLGSNDFDHAGTGFLDDYINSTSAIYGVGTCVAAGNENNYGCHYRGGAPMGSGEETIAAASSRLQFDGTQYYEDVQLRIGSGRRGLSVWFWGTTPALYSVAVTAPFGEYVAKLPPRFDSSTTINFIFDRTQLTVSYEIVERQSGDQLILLRFQEPAEGIWTLRIYYERETFGVFDLWLPLHAFVGNDTYFLRPDPDITICNPGNGTRAITCAGYSHQTGGIYIASSRGYTRDGRIKPSLAAPCVNIYGPLPAALTNRPPQESYGVMTGTSIAAAHTAGVSALIFEWALLRGNLLNMGGIELGRFLIKGAQRAGGSVPNREWGYGRLNAYGVFDSLRITE